MNALGEKLRGGGQAFGFWKMLPGTFGAEVAAGSGYDYVCIDLQHGLLCEGDLLPMMQAVRAGGSEPLVRVMANDPARIGFALDCGAAGVIVPLVNDASEAEAAARACRFPPKGERSFGPVRAAQLTGSAATDDLDERALCFVMVETAAGLRNVREIAEADGVDGVYIGPADLGLALGLPPATEITDERHAAAIEEVRLACREAGIVSGIHSDGAEQARKHAGAGFGMLTVRSDHGLLTSHIPEELRNARP